MQQALILIRSRLLTIQPFDDLEDLGISASLRMLPLAEGATRFGAESGLSQALQSPRRSDMFSSLLKLYVGHCWLSRNELRDGPYHMLL